MAKDEVALPDAIHRQGHERPLLARILRQLSGGGYIIVIKHSEEDRHPEKQGEEGAMHMAHQRDLGLHIGAKVKGVPYWSKTCPAKLVKVVNCDFFRATKKRKPAGKSGRRKEGQFGISGKRKEPPAFLTTDRALTPVMALGVPFPPREEVVAFHFARLRFPQVAQHGTLQAQFGSKTPSKMFPRGGDLPAFDTNNRVSGQKSIAVSGYFFSWPAFADFTGV